MIRVTLIPLLIFFAILYLRFNKGKIAEKRMHHKLICQFGLSTRLEKFQLPSLFNAHGQCLGLILEETECSPCSAKIHEEVMYRAMA